MSKRSQQDLTKSAQDFIEVQLRTQDSALLSAERRPSSAPWLLTIREQLAALAGLTANWDSYGAEAPRTDILEGALSLIQCLAKVPVETKPYVYPTPSGGVQFEWERGSRYFEIEVIGPFAATFHFSDSQARTMVSGELFEGEQFSELLAYIRSVEQAAT